MHASEIIAVGLTVLFVLALVVYRLLWGASQVAALDGLGRLPKLPKSWRRFLFGEHASN